MIKKIWQSALYRKALHLICRGGVWFVDIPRTSSSSIRVSLQLQLGKAYGKSDLLESAHNLKYQAIPSHLSARNMRQRLGEKCWQKLYTFSMVRNPWDRMWSMFSYRRTCGELPPSMSFEHYLMLFFEEPTHHNLSPYSYHGHYYQCADYLLDIDGKIMVDFVARYEHRHQDLQKIAAATGLKDLSRLHLNRLGDSSPYRQHYNHTTREMVTRWAEKDIRLFNYRF
ncbi:MAG: sulfotransferase family 2 domain-containing protein [Cyclobacteriaceae bacterium]|nr:sulfotransferase family 2 domain-containing protein [Cyclobacteriaceae bacterium]